MKLLPALCFTSSLMAQTWAPQVSNTGASLRGVSAIDTRTVFASGSGGTWLATTDGGVNWHAAQVPGAETLDFRGIRAIDARTIFLLSAGSGDKSRIFRTRDAGAHWTLVFANPDPQGFFDAIAFWDAQHGIVVGDQLEGRPEVLTTDDGGATWQRRSPPGTWAACQVMPPSVVASHVPPLPLANAVRASTALTPRSEARVLPAWGSQVCARRPAVKHRAGSSFMFPLW